MSGKTIGLLGAGRIGAMHAGILAKKAGKLVVADPASWRARRVAELHGAEVRSPEGMLASEDLDGLVLATPTDTHAGLLCEAARLGVPIFCEKPVALDVESTRRANAAAKEANIPVHVGFQRRFDAAYSAARERLAEGEIGDLRRVHMGTLDQAPAAREFLAASGGIFKDCLIHDFDARFPQGVPSLRECTSLQVTGDVTFGADVRAVGDVEVVATEPATLPEGARLEGQVELPR